MGGMVPLGDASQLGWSYTTGTVLKRRNVYLRAQPTRHSLRVYSTIPIGSSGLVQSPADVDSRKSLPSPHPAESHERTSHSLPRRTCTHRSPRSQNPLGSAILGCSKLRVKITISG